MVEEFLEKNRQLNQVNIKSFEIASISRFFFVYFSVVGKISKLRFDRAKLDPDRCAKCSLPYKVKMSKKSRTSSRIPHVLCCGHSICQCCIQKGKQFCTFPV